MQFCFLFFIFSTGFLYANAEEIIFFSDKNLPAAENISPAEKESNAEILADTKKSPDKEILLVKEKSPAAENISSEEETLSSAENIPGKETENISSAEKKDKAFKSFIGKTNLSFDLGYLGMGLRNQGWGIGATYEIGILKNLSIKPGFAHMSLWPRDKDFSIETVGISFDALYYPFARGLDWLYVGVGSSCDFMMYQGGNLPKEQEKDSVISVFPEIGWKQTFFNYVMTDLFFSYRIILNQDQINDFATDYVKKGFEYGIRFKLNISKIAQKIFTKKRK